MNTEQHAESNDRVKDLLARLEGIGVRVELTPDGPRLRGAKVPPELAAEAKVHKDELVALVQARPKSHHRMWQVPENLPLGSFPPVIAREQLERLCSFVMNQPSKVMDWVMAREQAYWERGSRWEAWQFDAMVASELVAWQFNRPFAEALEVILGMDECVEDWRVKRAEAEKRRNGEAEKVQPKLNL